MQDSRIYVNSKSLIQLRLKARGFSLSSHQAAKSLLSGKHASKIRGRGLSFEELRQYYLGDDIRNMDWKVSNRLRKPYVRVYEEEKERQVYFIVDQSASMFFGSEYKMKSVIAAEAAALGFWRVFKSGDRVGSIIFNQNKLSHFPCKRNDQHIVRIINEIERFNSALSVKGLTDTNQANTGLLNALKKLMCFKPHNALIIVISDFLKSDNDYLTALKQLAVKNDLIAVQVTDKLEKTLAPHTKFVASEGDVNLVVDGSSQDVLKHYADLTEKEDLLFINALKHSGIALLNLTTAEDVDVQLHRLLGGKA